jgi:predicted transposase YdaD
VFDVIRCIYNRDYDKINEVYKDKPLDTELALVIGSITKSQKIIDQALKLESEGEQMQMRKALQELEQRGVEAGREFGEKGLVKKLVKKKLAKGKSVEVIADELEEEVSAIQRVIDEIKAEKQE